MKESRSDLHIEYLMNTQLFNSAARLPWPPTVQRGGALLVALILIFMLSLMGIASMRGSTLERQMANNSIQTATTFQAAESASEMAINNEANLTNAINIADIQAVNSGNIDASDTVTVQIDLKQNIDMNSEVVLQYIGDGPAYGYSAGLGGSNFVAYRFEIKAAANVAAVRSRAYVTQGAYRIAPGR